MRRGDPQRSWEMPPIFQLLAAKGGVAEAELYQVFNMGIGMTVIVAADKADAALRFIRARRQAAWLIGEVVARHGQGQDNLKNARMNIFDELEWRGIGGGLHRRAGIEQTAGGRPDHLYCRLRSRRRTACTSATWCRCWPCAAFNCSAIIPSPWPAGRPAWSATPAARPPSASF